MDHALLAVRMLKVKEEMCILAAYVGVTVRKYFGCSPESIWKPQPRAGNFVFYIHPTWSLSVLSQSITLACLSIKWSDVTLQSLTAHNDNICITSQVCIMALSIRPRDIRIDCLV